MASNDEDSGRTKRTGKGESKGKAVSPLDDPEFFGGGMEGVLSFEDFTSEEAEKLLVQAGWKAGAMEQSRDSSSDVVPCCRSSADKFYKDLDDKVLSFKLPEKEIRDIADGAYQIVRAIVGRIGCIDDRFKSTEVIRVGSFEEGTRIQEPDEFDFLAVVDELLQPNAVEPVRVSKGKRGFMRVKVRDEALQKRWSDYMDNGDLLSFSSSNPRGTSRSFSSLVYSVYWEKSSPIVITKPYFTMEFVGVEHFKEPNIIVYIAWKSKHRDKVYKIAADLSPAILCHNVSNVITPDDCPYEHFYAEVEKCGRFLLIPGRSSDLACLSNSFNISLTEMEGSLVQSLRLTHKHCYRVLKFLLCNLCGKAMVYPSLSSYIVKSTVLHHAGDGHCKSDSLNSCVENVLRFLLKCLIEDRPHLPFMPSVFIREHNLFEGLTNYKWNGVSAGSLVMYVQCLRSVLLFHQRIRALPLLEYGYEKCTRYLEQMTEQLKKATTSTLLLVQQAESRWNVDMSTEDLLQKFGVSCEIVE